MRVVDSVVWGAIERRRRRLEAALGDPAAAQERVLLHLVRRAKGTEFGRQHQFGEIHTVQEFQARVPLATFEDVREAWQRAKDGERNVCWPGRTRYFAMTAGTTSGSKHVPVTRAAIRANQYAGALVVALCYRQMGRADVTSGRFLYLGGSTTLQPFGPSLVGDASGIMNAHIPFYARPFHLPAPDIAALTNWEAKIERICAEYLTAPIHVISGLPSWVVPLAERVIEAGRQRLGPHVRTLRDVWPNCGALVSFGMALEPFRPTLDQLLGGPMCYVNTFSSSEGGMTAVQDRQDSPGMLLLVNNGVFYEFIRLDESDQPKAARRWTTQDVELDVPYEMVLSSNGGMWGFRLGDVVRFVSLRPHRLVVVGRSAHVLSAFGEHLIGEELEAAVVKAAAASGAEVANFAVETVYPGGAEPHGRHRWHIEFRRPPADAAAFMGVLDKTLVEMNEDYASYRKGNLAIAEPELTILAPGSFYEWMKRSGRLGGQHKIPRVLKDPAAAQSLRAASDDLAGRGDAADSRG